MPKGHVKRQFCYQRSTLAVKGVNNQLGDNRGRKGRPWCDHCRKQGHTRDSCWKLHRRPADSKPNPRAYQSSSAEQTSGTPSSTPLVFSKEQLEQIQQLFSQYEQTSNILQPNPPGRVMSTYSLAQRGHSHSVLNVSRQNLPWIIDFRASDHMTTNLDLFCSYTPCVGNIQIKIVNGSLKTVARKGTIKLSEELILEFVLYVAKLSCNLIFVSKLAQDLHSRTKFFPSHCEFQDLYSKRTIGNARECERLYYLKNSASGQVQISSFSWDSTSSYREIMLWHNRLGHSSFLYLQKLFPLLSKNKNPNSFQWKTSQYAKHTRTSYPSRPYKTSYPFSAIHSDIWRPSRVTSLVGIRWFITFIDDHTHTCWIYLLKEKSGAGEIFKQFHTSSKTQFQKTIQVIRTDNGLDYFNSSLREYLKENRIIHQSFCIDTLQQNGIAERKNYHLVEVARAIKINCQVPKHYLGDAILTASLINHLPSKVIQYKTPCELL